MKSTGIRVGMSTPWDLWALDPDQQASKLAAIADAGVDHLFTADHVSFHGGHGADAIVEMAAAAGMEPRLGLYIGVYLLALRHPMVAARQISSLAQIAPGRITVGVGVGGEDRHEFEVCEIDPSTRGKRTTAAMSIVRRLLDGDMVDGDGTFYRFTDALIRPTPNPRVPFVVGGRSDAALERTSRLGDGWLAAWCSPDRFSSAVERVESLASQYGRHDVSWQHGLQVWLGVGDSPEQAAQFVGPRMESFYQVPFKAFAPYTPCGTPQQIAEILGHYVGAGATTLNLTPVGATRQSELEALSEIRRLLITRHPA